MITLQVRRYASARSCATCRHLGAKQHPPEDTSHPEPYCDVPPYWSLTPYVNILTKTFCARWDALPSCEAIMVYEQLTGTRL